MCTEVVYSRSEQSVRAWALLVEEKTLAPSAVNEDCKKRKWLSCVWEHSWTLVTSLDLRAALNSVLSLRVTGCSHVLCLMHKLFLVMREGRGDLMVTEQCLWLAVSSCHFWNAL